MSILRIERLEIHDFRCFKDISFRLGKMVTVIAGQNATGKSTILGLLGHCAELKTKDGKPILQKHFRTEFSEIIKASPEFDKRNQNVYTIYLSQSNSIPIDPISFRTTWQNGDRFRIIPKKTLNRNTEKKLDWPILYLGLSRLYPIGESEQPNTSDSSLTLEQKERFFREYKNILSMQEDPIDCSTITIEIQERRKKNTVGIKTDKYDPLCNSAGQDNLSQILLAIMSFELLKEERRNNWNGGLLLIDELDATLHPAAQNKLVKFLFDSAKELQIQVVFTTHSLSMLDNICGKCEHNILEQNNDYEIVYLTNRNRFIELLQNPEYVTIYYDMRNSLNFLANEEMRKITVYMEDDEARWLFTKLVRNYVTRLELPKFKFGYEELLQLLREDYKHCSNFLFVLDGDVEQREFDKIAKDIGRPVYNLMKLPGGKSPEELFFDYLKRLPGNHKVYRELASTGLSLRTISEHGPDSYTQLTGKRERNKFWFNQFKQILEAVYPYWEIDNQVIVDEFVSKFIDAFNKIASKVNVLKIRES